MGLRSKKFNSLILTGIVALVLVFSVNLSLASASAYAETLTPAQVSTNASDATNATQSTPAKLSVAKAKITLSKSSYTYCAKTCKPKVKVKLAGKTLSVKKDYSLKYENSKNAGKAKVIITGKGAYEGTVTKSFTIKKALLSKAKLALSKSSYTYTGKQCKPKVTAKLSGRTLKKSRDYTIKYSNNTKAGNAKVTIVGTGNYKGKKSVNFTINKKTQASSNTQSVASNSSGSYVMNLNTGVFHYSWCSAVKRMNPANKSYTDSRSTAASQCRSCGICKP